MFDHASDTDDCALTNKWINKNPLAKLHDNFEKGRNFYEISIILHGCVELLAVGGVVVVRGEPADAFFGSSIKPLKDNNLIDGDRLTNSVYIKSNLQEIVRSERLLRQYYKRDSCNMWSFHLSSTHAAGFFPVNPLRVDDHPTVTSIAVSIQSTIIQSFTRK